jgi:hypothetical protein
MIKFILTVIFQVEFILSLPINLSSDRLIFFVVIFLHTIDYTVQLDFYFKYLINQGYGHVNIG